MEKLYVEMNCSPSQNLLTKGMKGYIHAYVRGADDVPYAVVISGSIIDLVGITSLDVCENYTGNLQECLHQDTDKAFAIHSVTKRTFKPTSKVVEDIAEQLHNFIDKYQLAKIGTFNKKLRQLIADTLNKYGC